MGPLREPLEQSARPWRQRVGDLLRRVGRCEVVTLAAVGAIAAGIWGFAEIADEVVEGQTHTFDRRVLLAMRDPSNPGDPWGPKWLEEIGRDFTALGGMGILTGLTLAVCLFLAMQRKHHAMILVLAAVGGGLLLSLLLKRGFDRPRPDLVPRLSYVYTASFPSGHSMMSAVTYLTLGALLARLQTTRRLKVYLIVLPVLVTLAVGVSRVYLGVHWPTDVLAGWAAGSAWALMCWLAASWLQRRGKVEQ